MGIHGIDDLKPNYMHDASWIETDPTGGDPWQGGPVKIIICRICGVEKGQPAYHNLETEE